MMDSRSVGRVMFNIPVDVTGSVYSIQTGWSEYLTHTIHYKLFEMFIDFFNRARHILINPPFYGTNKGTCYGMRQYFQLE